MSSTPTFIADALQSFSGLSAIECRYLQEWRAAAGAIGVDAVEDLANRSWPCSIEGAVIGIFMSGEQAASWLLVRHNGSWAVAKCSDLVVSRSVDTLEEALAVIYPGEDVTR